MNSSLTNNTSKSIHNTVYKILTIGLALIWIINGLFCKLFNLVPRHQMIVARILGEQHDILFTKIIGVFEVMIGIWVLIKVKARYCAILQIILIATMNAIEYFMARDLLLFGKLNALLALILIVVIYYQEFILRRNLTYS